LQTYGKLPSNVDVGNHFGLKFDGMKINMGSEKFIKDI
jgi:hypothetical protein